MNKKLLIGGLVFALVLAFFIFNNQNNETNKESKIKIIKQKNEPVILKKNITKNKEAERIINVIKNILSMNVSNGQILGPYDIQLETGDYINQTFLMKNRLMVTFDPINITEMDLYGNIIFKEPLKGNFFVGYYYEEDDNVIHLIFSKDKENIENYLKGIEQEESRESERDICEQTGVCPASS